MRHRRLFVLLFTFCLLMPTTVSAKLVVADGMGSSRDAAIKDATRNAVELALGTYLEATTNVVDAKLVSDRIATSSVGVVRRYSVLEEKQDPIEDAYTVRLEVDVDDHKMEGVWERFLNDANAQNTFQEIGFDNRRVVILYSRKDDNSLPFRSNGVQTLLERVQDSLASRGFRVFLPDQLTKIKGDIVDRLINKNEAIQLARMEDADAVVLASISSGAHKTEDGLIFIRAITSLQAYDPSTGELFANVQSRGKTLSHADSYAREDAVARLAIDTGGKSSDALMKKIVKRFSTNREKLTVLNFTKLSMNQQDDVERLLRRLGWDYRINTQQSGYMEVELFVNMRPTDISWELMQAAEKANLPIRKESSKGARLYFTRK